MLARLSNLHSKILKTTALAITMLAAVGTSLTFAAPPPIPDENGTIHSCYLNNRGTLRVVANESECSGGETALHWNQSGDSPATYGVVLKDGTLVTSNSNNVINAYQTTDRYSFCVQLATDPKVVTGNLVNFGPTSAQGFLNVTFKTPDNFDRFTSLCNGDNSNVIFTEHNGPPVSDFDFVAF